jgi:hypothetical protein
MGTSTTGMVRPPLPPSTHTPIRPRIEDVGGGLCNGSLVDPEQSLSSFCPPTPPPTIAPASGAAWLRKGRKQQAGTNASNAQMAPRKRAERLCRVPYRGGGGGCRAWAPARLAEPARVALLLQKRQRAPVGGGGGKEVGNVGVPKVGWKHFCPFFCACHKHGTEDTRVACDVGVPPPAAARRRCGGGRGRKM